MIISFLAFFPRRSGLRVSRLAAWRAISLALVLVLGIGIMGCGKLVFPRLEFARDEPKKPSIPLSVKIDIPDALKQAQLFYRDSCNVPQAIPIGERLADQLKADAAQVFE